MSLETYAILTGYYSLVRLVFILAALAGALIWHVRTNSKSWNFLVMKVSQSFLLTAVMIEIVVIKCVIISAALIRIGFIYRELIIGVHTVRFSKFQQKRRLNHLFSTLALP